MKTKELWQMTRAEYMRWYEEKYQWFYGRSLEDEENLIPMTKHEHEVKVAIEEGKPVSPKVLADYPDLAK